MFPMFLSTLSLWLSLAIVCLAQTVPIIQTTSGKLHGKAVSSKTNAYLGIPYAQPPVGPLRFSGPKPLLTPATVRNTTEFGLSCLQLGGPLPYPYPAGEDCLTINVWTSPARKPRPVFVWIYGGSWTTGYSGARSEDLTSWSKSHPEIVFVSINYRLNLYGYANSPALSPKDSNAGLRDQRAAVEWVVTNIAAFGGDPNQIILGGYSAGSASVATHLYAYPSLPLARGAILMSAQAATSLTTPLIPLPGLSLGGPNKFPAIATAVGCDLRGTDYKGQLECVRSKSVAQLTDALNATGTVGMSPYVDNSTLFSIAEYKSRGRAGKFAHIPLLTGTTDNEGDIFVFDPVTNTINETASDLFTLGMLRCYDSQQSKYASSLTSVYRYRYMGIFPALSPPPLRAWHTTDQTVLFNSVPDVAPAATEYLQKAWSTFILNPDNGLTLLGWKKYKGPGTRTLVDIFRNSSNLQHPIQLEDPTSFDSRCASLGIGL